MHCSYKQYGKLAPYTGDVHEMNDAEHWVHWRRAHKIQRWWWLSSAAEMPTPHQPSVRSARWNTTRGIATGETWGPPATLGDRERRRARPTETATAVSDRSRPPVESYLDHNTVDDIHLRAGMAPWTETIVESVHDDLRCHDHTEQFKYIRPPQRLSVIISPGSNC